MRDAEAAAEHRGPPTFFWNSDFGPVLEMDFVTAEYLVCIHSQTTEMKV